MCIVTAFYISKSVAKKEYYSSLVSSAADNPKRL